MLLKEWVRARPGAVGQAADAVQADADGAGQGGPRWPGMPRVRLAVRGAMSSPVVQGLIALAIYLALWLPRTPFNALLSHPSADQLDQHSMDPNFFVWMLGWWPYAVSHLTDPLHTTQIGAPLGFSLAWLASIPLIGLVAAPLTATLGPVVAFNLLTVLAVPLSAWAAFVFCRRLTGRFWPGLLGGAVFGFSSYETGLSGAGELNLTYSLMLPLIGYLVLLWWDGAIRNWVFVVLTGLAMTAQLYIFLEIFADMTALLAVGLAVGYAMAGRSFRPRVARLAGLLGAAYVVGLVLGAPLLYVALAHKPAGFVVPATGLDLARVVITLPGAIGLPILVVAVALAALNWASKVIRFLSVMLAVVVLAAFGQAVHVHGVDFRLPWSGIWNWSILRNAHPARLMIFGDLVLAAMMAIFLAWPARKVWLRLARWLPAALVVAAMVFEPATVSLDALGSSSAEVPSFISTGEYRHYLSRGETVAVVSAVRNVGMLWQADTDFYFRLAGGFVGQAITPHGDLPPQIQQLAYAPKADFAQDLSTFSNFVARARVGAILVEFRYQPLWAGILSKIGLTGHLLGGVVVYPTYACSACHVPYPRTSLAKARHRHHRHSGRRQQVGVATRSLPG